MTKIDELKEKLLNIGIFIDNEYLDLYCSLIKSNEYTKKEKGKTERHHIIQRAYYKQNGLKIDNTSENIVNLSHFNHCLAHYYLCFCTVQSYSYINQYAFIRMSKISDKRFLDFNFEDFLKCADKYDEIYHSFVANQQKMAVVRWNNKDLNHNVHNKWFTNGVNEVFCKECPEWYERGRLSAFLRRKSELNKHIICVETGEKFENIYELKCALDIKAIGTIKRALNAPQYSCLKGKHYCYEAEFDADFAIIEKKHGAIGKIWITNGEESIMIDETSNVPDGWILGRKINRKKHTTTMKGMHKYTDGNTIIYSTECPDGFYEWHPEHRKCNDETKKKMSTQAKERMGDPLYMEKFKSSLAEYYKTHGGVTKNRRWITNGEIEKLIQCSGDCALENGWRFGRANKAGGQKNEIKETQQKNA